MSRIAAQCLARHRPVQSGSHCIMEFLGHFASLAAWRYPASQLIGTSAFGEKHCIAVSALQEWPFNLQRQRVLLS